MNEVKKTRTTQRWKRKGLTVGALKAALRECKPSTPLEFVIAETGFDEVIVDLEAQCRVFLHTEVCERRLYNFDDDEIDGIIRDDGTEPETPTC